MSKDTKFLLHVRLLEAKNLPAMDANGYSDPYVKFKVGKDKLRSPTKKKTLNPVWHEDFTFSVKDTKTDFKLEVYDEDRIGRNDAIGYLSIPVSFLEQAGQLHGWFPLLQNKTKAPIPGAEVNCSLCVDKRTNLKQYKPDSAAFKAIRSSILYRIGKAAENKDKEERESKQGRARDAFSVFVGTWNVGNAPPPEELSPWLHKGSHDFYVVGTQECDYKARGAYRSCKEDWIETLKKTVGSEYELLKDVHMWQIRLAVFVLKKHVPFIHSLEGTSEATGVGGVMGNKGGVVVAFSFHDLSLCFINAHLAAHQDKVKKRNDDVAEVVKNVKLGFKHKFDILNQYHHVFWMGDLNYRLNFGDQGDSKKPSKEQFETMVNMINENKYSELVGYDQLALEMKEKRVFIGFQEGDIAQFPPTFKVQRDQHLVYNEKRSPAWCDRILWRSFQGFKAEQRQYGCSPLIKSSDHKPVFGVFEMSIFRLPDAIDFTLGPASLKFLNLSARGLPAGDVGGTSDPYVEFFGTFVEGNNAKTAVKKKTLDAEWLEKDIPVIKLTNNSKARLRRCYLQCRVFDWDQVGGHDLLCSAVLPLEPAITGELTSFQLLLTSGGLFAGVLEGQMLLQWGEASK